MIVSLPWCGKDREAELCWSIDHHHWISIAWQVVDGGRLTVGSGFVKAFKRLS